MPSKSLNLPTEKSRRGASFRSKRGSSFLSVSQRKKLETFWKSAKIFYRKWHLNHLAPIPFITVYMLVGGFFFWWSENSAEFERTIQRRQFYKGLRAEFVQGVELAMLDKDLKRGQRRKLLGFLVDGLFEQLDILVPSELDAQIEEELEWTFITAMYFSGTLFTTIGYGDIACETAIGQIGTIVYSIIGIPVMLITLNELGKFLYKMINEFMAFLNRKWQRYVLKYWCFKSAPKKPIQTTKPSLRKKYSNPSEARQAQKEIERKHTHFFKDQRFAQKDMIFDFDLKSINEEPKATDYSIANDLDTSNLTIDESTRLRSDRSRRGGEGMEEEEMEMEEEVPRMHVLVAITFTVSWVLFCAALFKHVEDWSYKKSLYFVCISLLTVGLGDVKVARRGYMLLFFAFVMIGLSLVSMCINVIQNSIEDFYKRLLAQMLENIKNGENGGVNNNWLAKFLLPLLGKRRRESMMRKIREEAEKCGVEIPEDMGKIFEKPKDEPEKSDTTKSEFSDIEVEIQPPSEPDEEEEEEEIIDADVLLGIPAGWSRERRPSFQLDDQQMQKIPFADENVRGKEDDSEMERQKEAERKKPKISVPQLKIVPFTLIVTEEGEQRHVHSIECTDSHLP